MAWWFSPVRGRQFWTLYFSASWTIAKKRRSSRRWPVSPQRSIVSSRSVTCARTVPSGWPRRGFPHARPSCSTGSARTARSSSVSGARLVDAFCNPAVALAGQDHPRLVAVLRDRDEMGPILLDARPVVDQDEVEASVGPVRPRLGERRPRGLLHELALPAAVGSRGLRERGVRGAHVLLPGAGLLAVAGTCAEEAQEQCEQDGHSDDDENDCEYGHEARSLGRLLERRRPPGGGLR